MHHVTKEQYRFIWIREAMVTKKHGESHIDPRVRRIVKALNSCTGVTTVWSCSGHTQEEMRQERPGETPDKNDRAYLVFAIDEGRGEYVLPIISKWIQDVHGEDPNLAVRPSMSMTSLLWDGVAYAFKADVSKDMPDWYNCWSIEMKIFSNSAQTNKAEELFNKLADMLNTANVDRKQAYKESTWAQDPTSQPIASSPKPAPELA